MAVVSGAMGAGWPVLEEIAVAGNNFSVYHFYVRCV